MASGPHYSPAIAKGNLLFTSGQLPLLDRSAQTVPEGIRAQTRLVLEKIEELVHNHGLSKTDIVKTTAFITDVNFWSEVNDEYALFFGDHKPARSIIPVNKLHFGCLIEIEAVAVFGEE